MQNAKVLNQKDIREILADYFNVSLDQVINSKYSYIILEEKEKTNGKIHDGTDFMTKEEVTADTFENMENVTITSEDGTVEVYENPQLVHFDLFPDGYTYFRIRNLSNTEIKANNLDAQVTYTALMTDTLMED